MYHEIFVRGTYRLQHQPKHKILDLGSNIGLSVLSFKDQFPNSQVVAVEPDGDLFQMAKRNLGENHLDTHIEWINKAIWTHTTTVPFFRDGSDGSHVVEFDGPSVIQVETIEISELFEKMGPFSVLKMDIEGAENTVFGDLTPYLSQLDCIFLEYHTRNNEPQKLGTILNTLESAGFRIHIHTEWENNQPFNGFISINGFDTQINIFGVRTTPSPDTIDRGHSL